MNKAASLIEAEQLTKEQIRQRFIDHWNRIGINRHQFLVVPSMLGPVTITKRNHDHSFTNRQTYRNP